MSKLEEVSRNELLAKAKGETITRYKKSAGYKGFTIRNIDTTNLLRDNTIVIECNVGKYVDTLELEDVLYWIQICAEENQNRQINAQGVIKAIMNAVDGMDIKVDCSCPDFCLEETTQIKLLNGEVKTVKELKNMRDNNEEIWVYSVDNQGNFKPGKVRDVWISGQSWEMIEITLDNNKKIVTTPNHRYLTRDNEYVKAEELKLGQSLMPLYFKYENGYELVKDNEPKYPTQYRSVYKIVADTILKKEKQEAQDRTGEDVIQIHHKDFNKLNNYPSNLYPMGKLEHWYYHSHLGEEHKKTWIEAGQEFWESDPRRFEAREKQRKAAKEYQLNMWTNFTEDERREYILKSHQAQNKEKLSKSQKEVWGNYTEEERANRLKTNNMIVNNPMYNMSEEKMLERNKKISESHKKNYKKLSKEERQKKYGFRKGIKESDETKRKKSEQMIKYWKQHDWNDYNEGSKNKILEGAKKGRLNKRQKKLNNMTNDERRLFLFKEQLNKIDTSMFSRSEKNVLGHVKFILEKIYENNMDFTKENYNHFRSQYHGPTLQKVNEIIGDWQSVCNFYNINYNHKIIDIKYINYENPIDVYDIEVENYHNFYIDSGVILHNCFRFRL